MPNLRVIYLLRDPVERACSQAAKYFSARREGGLDKAQRAEVEVSEVGDLLLQAFICITR